MTTKASHEEGSYGQDEEEEIVICSGSTLTPSLESILQWALDKPLVIPTTITGTDECSTMSTMSKSYDLNDDISYNRINEVGAEGTDHLESDCMTRQNRIDQNDAAIFCTDAAANKRSAADVTLQNCNKKIHKDLNSNFNWSPADCWGSPPLLVPVHEEGYQQNGMTVAQNDRTSESQPIAEIVTEQKILDPSQDLSTSATQELFCDTQKEAAGSLEKASNVPTQKETIDLRVATNDAEVKSPECNSLEVPSDHEEYIEPISRRLRPRRAKHVPKYNCVQCTPKTKKVNEPKRFAMPNVYKNYFLDLCEHLHEMQIMKNIELNLENAVIILKSLNDRTATDLDYVGVTLEKKYLVLQWLQILYQSLNENEKQCHSKPKRCPSFKTRKQQLEFLFHKHHYVRRKYCRAFRKFSRMCLGTSSHDHETTGVTRHMELLDPLCQEERRNYSSSTSPIETRHNNIASPEHSEGTLMKLLPVSATTSTQNVQKSEANREIQKRSTDIAPISPVARDHTNPMKTNDYSADYMDNIVHIRNEIQSQISQAFLKPNNSRSIQNSPSILVNPVNSKDHTQLAGITSLDSTTHPLKMDIGDNSNLTSLENRSAKTRENSQEMSSSKTQKSAINVNSRQKSQRNDNGSKLSSQGRKKTQFQKRSSVQTLYPSLKELLDSGLLHPGSNVLSMLHKGHVYAASLTKEGAIIDNEGTSFSSPLEWCTSVMSSGKSIKTIPASLPYKRMYYKGKTLRDFHLPPEKHRSTSARKGNSPLTSETSSADKSTSSQRKNSNVRNNEEAISETSTLPENFWNLEEWTDVDIPMDIWKAVNEWS